MDFVGQVTEATKKAIRFEKDFVALHEPLFSGNEKKYLTDCIDTTFVSTVGPYVDKFERLVEEITGAKRAVALVNGTTALSLSLRVAGVRPGDEVLVPSMSFVATANAVCHAGGTPHFVDCNRDRMSICPDALESWLKFVGEKTITGLRNRRTGKRISSLVVMHCFGLPADMENLLRVANHFKITIIEDAAEALGSYYQGQHAGTIGLLGTFSFNGNKIVTTGGGGAVVTNDDALANEIKHLSTTAKVPHRWEYFHDQVGYNYRMPNINAALGCAQLENIETLVLAKRKLYERYEKCFSPVRGLKLFSEPRGTRSNYWLNAIIIDEANQSYRDRILECTNDLGIMTRPAWHPLDELPPFEGCQKSDLAVTRQIAKSVINLPSGPGLL